MTRLQPLEAPAATVPFASGVSKRNQKARDPSEARQDVAGLRSSLGCLFDALRHDPRLPPQTLQQVTRVAASGIRPRKRFVCMTDSRHDSPIFPNLYRNISPDQPDKAWVADFTHIRVTTGFCHLAVIQDASSRKVAGHALLRHLDTELALAALRADVMSRNPPKGCIPSCRSWLPIRLSAPS